MADRTPRELQTREKTERKKTWQRSSALPTPEPKDGLHYRWIRTSLLGQNDNPNVSARFREGYVPVNAADHPEMQLLPDLDSRFPDNIEVGGLMLCAIDKDIVDDREEKLRDDANKQMEAVDNSYLRQSDPRMPVLRPERNTRTSFGK
jgi:hypothetical protein